MFASSDHKKGLAKLDNNHKIHLPLNSL